MKISERVELYYLQKYPKKAKRVNTTSEIATLCQSCQGNCKTSANIIVCPGKEKYK